MKKKFVSVILAVATAISLTACGSEPFDASGYVKSCLDASYHEEYEAYAEFIDAEVEEAKAELEQQNQTAVDEEIASLGITVTEEQANKYLELLIKAEHLTKYEVGEAVESDAGFDVPVTVYPVDVYEQFVNGIEARYQKEADAGTLTDDTIFPIMLTYLEECIANAQYKDAQEITLQITQDNNEIWEIPEEEMDSIDDLLLPGV